MKTVLNYIDDLKEKTGSDYQSAKVLKIDKASLSIIRSKGRMADETAIKVADALGVSRDEVLIAAAIARSQGEVKKTWENFSRRLGMVAGFLLVIQSVSALPLADLQRSLYIMLNYRRWRHVNYCTPA